MVAEIRNFYSLSELTDSIEEEISLCKTASEEYGEQLGSILRANEPEHKDEEWFKALSGLQNTPNESKGKSKGKGKKGKKKSGWIQFKDISLSIERHGTAQILFDAVEEIKGKIGQLEKIRDNIEDLKKLGLGENIIYITYLREGVPEKIVLHKQNEDEQGHKFEFNTTISLTIPA